MRMLLKNGDFPKQLHESEVKKWVTASECTQADKGITLNWKPWSTDTVLATASDFLHFANGPIEPVSANITSSSIQVYE